MTIVLYAIIPSAPRRLRATGTNGAPLRLIRTGDLAAVVGDHEAPPEVNTFNVWAFETALESLMERGPLLPARFATAAESDEEIRHLLHSRADELGLALELVTGAVEIACREPDTEDENPARPPASGTQYLLGLVEREQTAQQRRDRLEEELAGLYRAKVERSPTSTAYLVEPRHRDELVRRATALGQHVSGPWPPYSFTSIPRITQPEAAAL